MSATSTRVRLLSAAALSVGLAGGALAAPADEVFRKVQRQVVIVDVLEAEQVVDSFSGIVFARGQVVVPCDGIRGESSIRIRSGDATIAAAVAHRDLLRNLCLLDAGALDAPSVEIARADTLGVGDRAYAISNALGMGIAVSEGVVSALRASPRGLAIQFTAPVAPGSDGGGLFNQSGQLVGVIRYQKLDGQNVNFAAPAQWLGQIAERAASQTALGTARDIAVGLARGSKWADLGDHARARLAVARDDVEAWRWLALSASRRNEHGEARDAYKEILALEPEDLSATLGRGWAQHELGEHAAALESARAAIALRREDARPWLLAAYAEIGLKRPQDARKSLESAVAADPWNHQAQGALGVWARDSGDYAAAAAAFRMQSRLQPGNIHAWIDLANVYARQSRYDRALNAAEQAIKLDASNGEAVLLKGHALAGLGRKAEGIDTLKRGLAMKSKWPHWGWYWLASAYLDVRLHAEAIEAFRETLRIEPGFLLARQWLASTLEQSGYLEEALAEIDTVATSHPKLPWVWRRRGAIHAAQSSDAKAIADYEQSLALEPRQPWVWRALVEANRRDGRATDARRAYERLLELDRTEAETAYRENFLPFEKAK